MLNRVCGSSALSTLKNMMCRSLQGWQAGRHSIIQIVEPLVCNSRCFLFPYFFFASFFDLPFKTVLEMYALSITFIFPDSIDSTIAVSSLLPPAHLSLSLFRRKLQPPKLKKLWKHSQTKGTTGCVYPFGHADVLEMPFIWSTQKKR